MGGWQGALSPLVKYSVSNFWGLAVHCKALVAISIADSISATLFYFVVLHLSPFLQNGDEWWRSPSST